MNWQAIAVLISLTVAVGTAAYWTGVMSTRVDGITQEMKNIRDRINTWEVQLLNLSKDLAEWMSYWKRQ